MPSLSASALVLSVLLLAVMLAASCNELDEWRDGQIAESERIAQGSQITPPAQPISVPDSVKRELPLDESFTVLRYEDGGHGGPPHQHSGGSPPSQDSSSVTLTALSAWDATRTALWLVRKLGELGYDSGDSASRVLEGTTYTRERGDYRSLYVKLSLNTAEQCMVEYRASK